MSSSGALVILSCNETDPRIDPSRYFNLSANTTSVVKTAGGRCSAEAINSLYSADQMSRIGMIVVTQHTGCASSTGSVEDNIRSDIAALKASPYIRNEIPIIGYLVDVGTGQLREVNVPRSGQDEEARRRVLSELDGFGPFWS